MTANGEISHRAPAFKESRDVRLVSRNNKPLDELARRAQVDYLDARWNIVLSVASEAKGKRRETP